MERLRKHARKGEKLATVEDAGRTFLEKYEKMKRR